MVFGVNRPCRPQYVVTLGLLCLIMGSSAWSAGLKKAPRSDEAAATVNSETAAQTPLAVVTQRPLGNGTVSVKPEVATTKPRPTRTVISPGGTIVAEPATQPVSPPASQLAAKPVPVSDGAVATVRLLAPASEAGVTAPTAPEVPVITSAIVAPTLAVPGSDFDENNTGVRIVPRTLANKPVTFAQAPAAPEAPAIAPVVTAPVPATVPVPQPVITEPATQPVTGPMLIIAPETSPGPAIALSPVPVITSEPTVPVPVPVKLAAPTLSAAAVAPVASYKGTLELTPEAAAELAQKNNLDLQINDANIKQVQAQLLRAVGLDNPTLTASATLGRQGPISSIELGGAEGEEPTEIALGDPTIMSGSLSLTKPLYTQGKIKVAQDIARAGVALQEQSGEVIRRNVNLGARIAVFNTLRLVRLATVAQQNAVAVAAHLDLSQKLAEAGVVAKFEVVQAETELANAQGSVIYAFTKLEDTKAQLKRLLTIPQDTDLILAEGVLRATPQGTQEDLVNLAYQKRPEILFADTNVRLSEKNLVLAHKNRNLSVALVGNLGVSRSTFSSGGYSWSIALSAQKAIFDGHAEASEVMSAEAKLDVARISLEKQRQEISLEVSQTLLALDGARERVRVAEQGVIEAKERLRISKVRYESGLGLGVEVLDAETALAAADVNVVNASYEVQIAVTDLYSVIGLQ